MEATSSFGQKEENSSSPADLRQDARFKVNNPGAYLVTVTMGHKTFEAICTDYSPFGLGLRIELAPDLPLFSIGESIDLQCNFSGSKFNARGAVANTRVERAETGDFVRLGIALSRSAEVVRPAHVKRRTARIQMNEGVSPLIIVSDELRFGETVFAKMTDISQGGMRLVIDRHPLPFLEKQRHWFEIILPIFGKCRAYCRIAYVRREEPTHRYIVGCEFVDGGVEQDLRALEDWLFFGNVWLTRSDIQAAGFSLLHIDHVDEKFRVLVSAADPAYPSSFQSNESDERAQHVSNAEAIEFSLSKDAQTHRLVASFVPEQQQLVLKSADIDFESQELFQALWKSLLIFALHNRLRFLKFEISACDSLFVKSSIKMAVAKKEAEFTVEKILASDTLNFSLWKKIYGDLKKKKDLILPTPSSFIRRLFLF
jgi:hypothetical protein